MIAKGILVLETVGAHLDKEMEVLLANIGKKIKASPPKPVMSQPKFKLDLDIPSDEIIKSETVGNQMPTIHNDNSASCLFLTDRGIFPTNRKRVSWSDSVIFENDLYKITATSLTAKTNPISNKIEEQSTNQNDLDVLYAIIAHFSDKFQGEAVKIEFSSIKKLLGWDSYNSGKYYQLIQQSIDRIDGLQLRVLDKKSGESAKVGFFERPTPRYIHQGNGYSKSVIIKLDKFVFNQIVKKTLFLPLRKRGMIKSLVGKWLLSYVFSRLPNIYDITIEEAIRRSGYTGRKNNFVREIRSTLLELSKLEICNGVVTTGHDQKIVFFN